MLHLDLGLVLHEILNVLFACFSGLLFPRHTLLDREGFGVLLDLVHSADVRQTSVLHNCEGLVNGENAASFLFRLSTEEFQAGSLGLLETNTPFCGT